MIWTCIWSQLIHIKMFMKIILFSSLDYRIVLCLNSLYSYFQAPHNVPGIARSRVSKRIS